MSAHATHTAGIDGNPWIGTNGWYARRVAYLSDLMIEAMAVGDRKMLDHIKVELAQVPEEYRAGKGQQPTPRPAEPAGRSEALPGQYAADVVQPYKGLELGGKRGAA